ncbi:MAG: DegT/DnrJ/EryC1/StrS family aminotransferase, partial [Pseudanabaena sp.]
MTDSQAALGASQMQRLDEFVSRRQFLARRYHHLLRDLPISLPYQHLDKISKSHRQVFEELRQEGIGVNLHYIPVHTQPHYQSLGFQWGDYPEAEKYYQSAISIPLY